MKIHWTKFLIGAALAAALPGGAAMAAPLVNLSILGSTTNGGSYTGSLSVTAGETIYYEVVGQMSPVGTTNSFASKTITSLTPSTDGISSLSYILQDAGANPIQISFNSDAALGNGFQSGTGAKAGTLASLGGGTNNELTTIRPIEPNGTYVGVSAANTPAPIVIETGSFVVDAVGGSGSQVAVSWGGTGSGFKINGGSVVAPSNTTEGAVGSPSADPYFGYTALTLTSVPEPTSMALLGISGLALATRRRRAL